MKKKTKKVILFLIVILGVFALLVSMLPTGVLNFTQSQEEKGAEIQTKTLTDNKQDEVVADLQTMASDGYRPTEIEQKLKQSIASLDKEHSTRAVREFMNAIEETGEYFGQLLSSLSGEIQYALAVDGIKDPVKDRDKLSNELAKGYLAEMARQYLLVRYVDSYFYIEPDAQYVLNKYGKYVAGDYKDYLNLVAKEQSDPIFDDKAGMYDLDRLAEDLLFIENARDRWKNGEFVQDWSELERNLFESFFPYSHATFLDEKIENKGTDNESYTYTLKPSIRKKYEEIMLSNKDSRLAKDIEGFLAVLDETDNVVNDKVDNYLSDLIEKRFEDASGDETKGKSEEKTKNGSGEANSGQATEAN